MKSLYSCGCSFLSCSNPPHPQHNPIKSFVELYCEQHNFQHTSLARSGSTNFLIRLQIDYAIEHGADYVVVGATSSDRIDFTIESDAAEFQSPNLQDIVYTGYYSQSEHNVPQYKPWVISDSISNWADSAGKKPHGNHNRSNVSREKISAIKQYVANLHHNGVASKKDYYIVSDGLRKLQSLNIPFVFIPGPLHRFDWGFIGSALWTDVDPWSCPHGICHDSINHNPQSAHDLFLNSLNMLTTSWTNNETI